MRNRGVIMKFGSLLVLMIALNLFFISAIGQSSENPFGSATSDSTSLKGDVYYLPEGTKSLPDFSTLTPVGSIYTKALDIPQRSFDSGFPGVTDRFEWFAIKYTGQFYVETEGEYAFRLVSDDGSRLFIDGKKIIDNDGEHSPTSVSGSVYLTQGQHQIEVDYYQGPRYYIALQLFWTPPGGPEEISKPTYIPQPSASGEGTGTSQGVEPSDIEPSASGCTWCPEDLAGIDLTGTWSCDDGGTYYITQLGYIIWWSGENSAVGPDWSNVARGILSNCVLTLEYTDVPKGSATGFGTLVLEVLSKDEMVAKEKPQSYSGSHWVRSRSMPQPPENPPANTAGNPPIADPWEDQSVRQLIDEWLLQQDKCLKKVYPGAYMDEWGRICGETQTAMISCDLDPDHPADWDSYHYLWYNNWCPDYYPYRVQDYVKLRQSGNSFDSLAGCKGESESCIS
jgi:hypothetical protein